MKAFRRGAAVVLAAIAVGMIVRLRGQGEDPPVIGGWRELRGPEFR